MSDIRLALGLMSGTSLDGIDAALIETGGVDAVRRRGWLTIPYDHGLRFRFHRGVDARLTMRRHRRRALSCRGNRTRHPVGTLC